jgi:CRP/FNR family transcriptional regulator, anaerobic regulatory protein
MGESIRSGVSHALDGLSGLGERPPAESANQNRIARDVPVRTLSTGEILFHEGDLKAHLHEISAGVISVYRTRTDRPHEVIEFVFAGDVLGLGYLEYQIYCARAVVETQVKCLPLSAMENILLDDNRAKQRHAEAIQREFAFRRNLLVTANRRRPVGRVAAFLFALSQLNRNEGRDPTIVGDSLKCGMVAESLGLDLDSLGGALVELEKKELIEQCPPLGLRLTNLGGLESLAGGSAIAFA